MIHISRLFSLTVFVVIASFSWAQNYLIEIGFDGDSPEANQVTVMGAGFGSFPQAEISFEGATDGWGMIVNADPYEGVMLMTQSLATSNCALLRASIRAESTNLSLYLASIDQGESTYVSTITPNNPSSFVGRYNRIAVFFLPFQGLLQIINTSETDPLTVYVDNFEVLEMGEERIEIGVDQLVATKSGTELYYILIKQRHFKCYPL